MRSQNHAVLKTIHQVFTEKYNHCIFDYKQELS